METPENKKTKNKFIAVLGLLVILFVALFFFLKPKEDTAIEISSEEVTNTETIDGDPDKIENGIHVRTGFVAGEGLTEVVQNCTTCHSAKLVTQNRMSKEQWQATIRWMQKTQNLWPLGDNEEIIINYLATHYAPDKKGRRQNLADVEWYTLNDN